MLQLLQHLGNGRASLIEVPSSFKREGVLIIHARASLVSAGTERMLVDFGKAGLIGKVLAQPEKARQAWGKVCSQGLLPTLGAIRSKLSWPIPLGYCHVGKIVHPSGEFQVGDRVVSNSNHAEVVTPNIHLCARVPDEVDDEQATFTPLAAIALNGIDLLRPSPGEQVVVVGLGLIGQLAVRILIAKGCKVMGLDPDPIRRAMAERCGAYVPNEGSDPVRSALLWTQGQGAAGVLITASSPSHVIVSQAARSCRWRGRVVLVGVVGLRLNRADFYANEATFQVSQSYGERTHEGPGSAKANFTEVLTLMASGHLKVGDLITHRFDFAQAPSAYEQLANPASLGIVLRYPGNPASETGIRLKPAASTPGTLAVIGAGNYATRTLLPALARLQDAPAVKVIASNQGYQGYLAAERFGAEMATTDISLALNNPDVAGVIVTTRHDEHASLAQAALAAGKYPWIEKPLALKETELAAIAASAEGRKLMVGFNRRFAPAATKLKVATESRPGPKRFSAVINAGVLEKGHWTLDCTKGGGRIVGEACHFVDLARFLVGSPIRTLRCTRRDHDGQDGGCFVLDFVDGSSAIIDYRTDLPDSLPKEDIEFSGQGWSSRILNWTRLTSEGLGVSWRSWFVGPQKGQREALKAYLSSLTASSTPSPIPLPELLEVSRAAILMQGLSEGESASL
jgi:predicted dehydrogenase/D-arabinose 1-dehydrogenase-like Zn-dependent alcohol dehydrogenase